MQQAVGIWMMKKRISFIRLNDHLISDLKLEETLRAHFADHEFDVFTIKDILQRQPFAIIINCLIVFAMYGLDILSGKKKFRSSFWRTPFIFHHIRKTLRRRIKKENYHFTFQAQSLFDGSIPGLPHFVYTDHTHLANLNYPNFDRRKLFSKSWIELEKEIYHNADLVFVWSKNIGRSLVEQYEHPQNRVTCANAGSNIKIDDFKPDPGKEFTQNILFIGSDWERKGGPHLINAFKQILTKYPHAQLTIAGSSPRVDIPNCKVVGYLPVDQLKSLYEKADIFCMPTLLEPFGIVYLEAMSAGLPIVATRLGAIPDFVQDGWNGWLVEPGDVEEIANAITKLFDDPEQCRLFGSRSYQLAQEHYNWPAVGKNIQKHILNYLNSN
jgi:glycosyltransferase involved in cell wall biosynthesis